MLTKALGYVFIAEHTQLRLKDRGNVAGAAFHLFGIGPSKPCIYDGFKAVEPSRKVIGVQAVESGMRMKWTSAVGTGLKDD